MNRGRNKEIRILLSSQPLSWPITSGKSLYQNLFTFHLQTNCLNEMIYNISQNEIQTPYHGPQKGLHFPTLPIICLQLQPHHLPFFCSLTIKALFDPPTGCTSFYLIAYIVAVPSAIIILPFPQDWLLLSRRYI